MAEPVSKDTLVPCEENVAQCLAKEPVHPNVHGSCFLRSQLLPGSEMGFCQRIGQGLRLYDCHAMTVPDLGKPGQLVILEAKHIHPTLFPPVLASAKPSPL